MGIDVKPVDANSAYRQFAAQQTGAVDIEFDARRRGEFPGGCGIAQPDIRQRQAGAWQQVELRTTGHQQFIAGGAGDARLEQAPVVPGIGEPQPGPGHNRRQHQRGGGEDSFRALGHAPVQARPGIWLG